MLSNEQLHLQIKETEQLIKQAPQDALKNALALQAERADFEPVQLLVGRCQRYCGQLNASQATLQAILQNTPLNILARMELATILHLKKEYRKAIDLLVETTRLLPEFHEVWKVLSQHLMQIGDEAQARYAIEQHDIIEAFNIKLARAQEHFNGSRLEEAESLCRELLELIPTEVRTRMLLARIAMQFDHVEVAALMMEYCANQKPTDLHIGIEYTKALLLAKQNVKALEESQRLLLLAPEETNLLSLKAEAQVRIGDFTGALINYAQLIFVHPRKDLCLLKHGNVLRILGQADAAITEYKKVIKLGESLGEAYWSLGNMRSYKISEEDITAVTAQLEDQLISLEDNIYFNFFMGKAMEDRNQYSRSFNYYKIANDLVPASQPASDTQRNDKLIRFFTSEYFERIKETRDELGLPVFIIGFRCSGLTLVEQILASHSRVDGTMELTEIASIARHLSPPENKATMDYCDALVSMDSALTDQLALRYANSTAHLRHGAPCFTDRMPDNYQHIGLIKTIFPNAKIIDVRRDPMACGFDVFKRFFVEGATYSFDLAAIGFHYREYLRLMNHWNRVLPDQILSVSYEKLVTDLRGSVKSILDYCGLDLEQPCLEFYKNQRPVTGYSAEQVRQPVYSEGLSQWKNYEAYLGPLRTALGD